MNLVLLDREDSLVLPAGETEAEHLLRVIKISCGKTFWCGVKNGRRGLATVLDISPEGAIRFSVEWEKNVALTLPPVRLLVGLSRPQTMKKIFAAAGEIGCSRVDVFQSEKGDPAYLESSIWKSEDATLLKILEKTAEQTCVPALPDFSLFRSLSDFFSAQGNSSSPETVSRIALDVYENQRSFSELAFQSSAPVTLAIGSERGWSEKERQELRAKGFVFAHLGERVLRVEMAVAVALATTLSKIDFWRPHTPLTLPRAD